MKCIVLNKFKANMGHYEASMERDRFFTPPSNFDLGEFRLKLTTRAALQDKRSTFLCQSVVIFM